MNRCAISWSLAAAICALLGGVRLSQPAERETNEYLTFPDLPMQPRNVRVLVVTGADAIRIESSAALQTQCRGPAGDCRIPPSKDLLLKADSGAMRIEGTETLAATVDAHANTQPLRLSSLHESEWSPEIIYPGDLRATMEDNRLSVVNLVNVEDYVASVVASETWPTFTTESFRTQAIIARTFVLYQMSRASKSGYDVTATQGSQVYRGIRSDPQGKLAADAAEYTRGVVCTFNDGTKDRLFCTYYSAACGGVSQSAAALGAEGDIAPLAGGVKCDYCRIAPPEVYRWGPVEIPASEVLSRLAARYPEFDEFRRIVAITPLDRTPSGRPVSLKIEGQPGESRTLLAERFRLALGGSIVKSTDCRIRVNGGEVIFDKGRGFGHGLGLCQWGMQGQTLEGRRAAEILRHYYPGSKLARAY